MRNFIVGFSLVNITNYPFDHLDLQEYRYISSKRLASFYSSKPHPQDFTVLVRSIPVSSGRSISEVVESFFKEYYPTTYLSHSVIHRTSKLKNLIVSTLPKFCYFLCLHYAECQTFSCYAYEFYT